MARPVISAARVPTPGPWLVRGEAEPGASPEMVMLGVEPATDDRPGGFPYLVRQDRPVQPGGSLLHIATGIQRLADARLMAAAPDLAAVVLRLLTSPAMTVHDLDPGTRPVRDAAWDLLVRVAPQPRMLFGAEACVTNKYKSSLSSCVNKEIRLSKDTGK